MMISFVKVVNEYALFSIIENMGPSDVFLGTSARVTRVHEISPRESDTSGPQKNFSIEKLRI